MRLWIRVSLRVAHAMVWILRSASAEMHAEAAADALTVAFFAVLALLPLREPAEALRRERSFFFSFFLDFLDITKTVIFQVGGLRLSAEQGESSIARISSQKVSA